MTQPPQVPPNGDRQPRFAQGAPSAPSGAQPQAPSAAQEPPAYGQRLPSSSAMPPSPYETGPQNPYDAPAPGVPAPYAGQDPHRTPYSSMQPVGFGPYAGQGAGWGSGLRRPGTVTAGVVMTFVGAALMVFSGLVVTTMPDDLAVTAGVAVNDDYALVVGGITLLWGLLLIPFAIVALRGKMWSVITLTVMGGIYLLSALFNLVNGDPVGIVGVLYIGVAVGLMWAPASRAWLRAKRGQ